MDRRIWGCQAAPVSIGMAHGAFQTNRQDLGLSSKDLTCHHEVWIHLSHVSTPLVGHATANETTLINQLKRAEAGTRTRRSDFSHSLAPENDSWENCVTRSSFNGHCFMFCGDCVTCSPLIVLHRDSTARTSTSNTYKTKAKNKPRG